MESFHARAKDFLSIVRSGEKSGNLDDALAMLEPESTKSMILCCEAILDRLELALRKGNILLTDFFAICILYMVSLALETAIRGTPTTEITATAVISSTPDCFKMRSNAFTLLFYLIENRSKSSSNLYQQIAKATNYKDYRPKTGLLSWVENVILATPKPK